MSEWWTYRLSDFLLFSPQSYYRLFELYNQAVWPAQLPAVAVGAAIILLLLHRPAGQGRIITVVVAAAWLWVAFAYHLQHYATINWAARFFALIFAAQAMLLVWTGVLRGRLFYGAVPSLIYRAGLGVFVFALVIHPLLAPLQGRSWLQSELFAIAPDPTAIATLGLILLAAGKTFWYLMIIPLVWCGVSIATLWAMGSAGAWVVSLGALAAMALAIRKTLGGRR